MTARALILTAGAAALALSTIVASPAKRYVWNLSASVPIGLYRLRPVGKLAVSDIVAVEPPEALARFLADGRYLPRGLLLLKQVAALPGETVCRTSLAITIDDGWAAQARQRDGRGQLLPDWQGCRVVADGEVFLMNAQSADSLDGRYFGVLPVSAIIGQVQPIWTSGEE